jgi:hypothetical protein
VSDGEPEGDDGLADPALAAALEARSHAQVLSALAVARVFTPVSAVATSQHVTAAGLRADSTAEMAVLLLEAEGARALPAFTSVPALLRWRADARPVALQGPEACRAALDEGAQALVLDVADAAWEVDEHELRALAAGYVPVAGAPLASRRAEVALTAPSAPAAETLLDALRRALAGERLRAAQLLEGPDGLVLGVTPRRPMDPAALAALAQRVRDRLGAELPPEGLDLAQVPRGGPGSPVLRRRFRPGR